IGNLGNRPDVLDVRCPTGNHDEVGTARAEQLVRDIELASFCVARLDLAWVDHGGRFRAPGHCTERLAALGFALAERSEPPCLQQSPSRRPSPCKRRCRRRNGGSGWTSPPAIAWSRTTAGTT